jgi:uncharacterized protein VirK/YbjX
MSIGSVLKLARQGHHSYWSPPRMATILWGASSNLSRQLEIFQVMALPAFVALVRVDPIFPFKYLTRDYLARGLTVAERASCFAHHYRQLNARFPTDLLTRVLNRDVTIFELHEGGTLFSITLGLSRQDVREGELFLHLQVDGDVVFALQFTIVPGRVVGSEATDVLLISRLQGTKGSYNQIHLATKTFREVAPAALLLAALQGIAEALGIWEMASVCATSQFSYSEECANSLKDAYDNFFLELGATKATDYFFSSPIPMKEKPLALVGNGHKARTEKKRAFKLKIAEDVCRFLCESH